MATSKRMQELILSKLEVIEKEVKEVRNTDIPNLKIEVAVVKEKSNTSAKIISGIGGILAVGTSVAIAWFK